MTYVNAPQRSPHEGLVPTIELQPTALNKARHAVDGPDKYIKEAMLSAVPAQPINRRLAIATVIVSSIIFLAVLPYVRVPLARLPSFIPAYEAALAVIDLVTAILLFNQFMRSRSRALLVLASGYLFNALITIVHALSFPDAFSPTGLLGAGDQTTVWLYVLWHAGFPGFVLGYAMLRRADPSVDELGAGLHRATACAVALVVALVAALTLLVSWGMHLLPILIEGGNYSRLISTGVSPGILLLCILALAALWQQRRPSVLDLWLMVVMCAWIFDVTLSAVISSSRYDLGWYAGRSYGLLATSFVLIILLLETSEVHARLARAQARLMDRARELDRRVVAQTHDVRQSNEALKREVSERRQAEQELLRTRAFLDIVIESVPAMLLVKDAKDGKCVLLNGAGEKLLGCDRAELVGRNVHEAMPLEQGDLIESRNRDGVATYEVYEHSLSTRNKGVRMVRTTRVPMLGEDGEGKYILRFSEDITNQKQIEDQLRQSQKMEAIGQLTGGVAHDFNNLLAVIVGNLDLLSQAGTSDSDKDELVQDALGAALSGAKLTRRLLAFARKQPLKPELVDANELVRGMSRLLNRSLSGNIEIQLDLDPSIPRVVVDRIQLETALTNLATNARDAMPDGGKLLISTQASHLDEEYAAHHSEVEAGRYIAIEVTDTGEGMSAEVLEHIFEPFYTTKGLGEGTGLGLSMVFGFIKQSGGHINVYSEPGRGTTFRLFLRPGDAHSSEAGIQVPPLQPARMTGAKILVVEDNPKLREVVVKHLKSCFSVVAVDNARSALDMFESGAGIDLLFSDVVLPGGQDGFSLAREVGSRYPGCKILLTSGFPAATLPETSRSDSIRILAKPYRMDELTRSLFELLGISSELMPVANRQLS